MYTDRSALSISLSLSVSLVLQGRQPSRVRDSRRRVNDQPPLLLAILTADFGRDSFAAAFPGFPGCAMILNRNLRYETFKDLQFGELGNLGIDTIPMEHLEDFLAKTLFRSRSERLYKRIISSLKKRVNVIFLR